MLRIMSKQKRKKNCKSCVCVYNRWEGGDKDSGHYNSLVSFQEKEQRKN